ncbi:TetR/AcrR family transcriptional regulator [Neobacillus drentensis]|uniref:TetR/AcrR family transcriptional regulator n=1 Tax=Neobacillus drentensis TaxID=220684 RepID=UPI0028658DFD|nr:TetR/AcrR family transcriptional regulator [Neobacillus drentensis]MDR7238934.1 AcrR family transcriptional regulator [Neobacillus drentensis]
MVKADKQMEAASYKETYQTIIKTAQRLFMELGYRAVSTRQIAQFCGVTQPAIYHYFKNKQTLYVAVIQQTLHHTESDLKAILGKFPTFQERLTQIAIYMMIHFEMDLEQMFHDISHELGPDNQQLIHQRWIEGFFMPIVTMINDGILNEEIKNPESLNTNSTELAYLILNVIKANLQTEITAALTQEERKIMAEKKAKLMVAIFINGIRG